MFLKNRNISSKSKRSKVTNYAALSSGKSCSLFDDITILDNTEFGSENDTIYFSSPEKIGNGICDDNIFFLLMIIQIMTIYIFLTITDCGDNKDICCGNSLSIK